jgi:DNA repair ATPase RecN
MDEEKKDFKAQVKEADAVLDDIEALVRGDCDKCPQDFREKLLFADFYIEQLKDLHANMLKTLQEVREERKQLQGTVARLVSVYERLERLNDKEREAQDQCNW